MQGNGGLPVVFALFLAPDQAGNEQNRATASNTEVHSKRPGAPGAVGDEGSKGALGQCIQPA